MSYRLFLFPVLASALTLGLQLARPSDPLPGFPRVMLWAWERPEDLRFLDPENAGVAFLARTIGLDADRVGSRPRLQPLRVSPGTVLMAVIRLESTGHGLPPRTNVIREVMKTTELPGVRALQIDFDARESERPWYAAVLRDLRQALPATLPLTITALASWCEQDSEQGRWIRDLPIADASPMLFRMGPGENLPAGDFAAPVCQSSIGVSTDELPARVPRGRRLFFFHPHAWTLRAYEAAIAQARRWR